MIDLLSRGCHTVVLTLFHSALAVHTKCKQMFKP